ncbi:MAG: biotin transporter BioY [Candidatus Thermoplasmatota archaeon]
MEVNLYINKFKEVRFNFYRWRYELGFVEKMMLALGFACLTGLLAQIRISLPWTPVPITGQTFGVLLGAVILGKWGGISQGFYVGIGAAGVPWFTAGNAGFAYLAGPTGGYLIGFIVAAFFVGYLVDRYVQARNLISMFGLMLFANFAIVYGIGMIYLYGWLSLSGVSIDIIGLLMMGMIPFIIGDTTKIILAATIAYGITPKTSYTTNRDAKVL